MNKRKYLFYSLLWVAVALGAIPYIYQCFGTIAAFQYLSCYAAEKLLSIDNLVMFYVIFTYFKISKEDQRRCLNIGIFSALIMRFVFIFTGSWLINAFHWLNYAFGAFLLYSSWCLFFTSDEDNNSESLIARVQKLSPVLSKMAIVITCIEVADILFAFDSVPASFGITSNPLIIFIANVFAILGLRSMYFLILDYIERFTWLNKFCGIVLFSIAAEMLWPLLRGLI